MNVLQVTEITELRFVHRRLRADGQRLSNLRNHHADLARGHLHPGMLRHGEHQAEFEAEAGHEQLRLVSRFPMERQGVVSGQLGSESFADQSDLGGTDAIDRSQKNEETGCRNNSDHQKRRCRVECHRKEAPPDGLRGSLPS